MLVDTECCQKYGYSNQPTDIGRVEGNVMHGVGTNVSHMLRSILGYSVNSVV
jgi:hypothetical protein